MATLEPCRDSAQLGGFAHQTPLFGAHTLRTFLKVADSFSVCNAVLFVDVANAYHRLIRELVMGVGPSDDLQRILDRVRFSEDLSLRLNAHCDLQCTLKTLGAPELLLRLVRSIHVDTWCTVTNKEILRTCRGTRPGSPVADAIFHA